MNKRWISFLLVPLAACSASHDRLQSLEPVIRVENGVTIVENPTIEMADSNAWEIDSSAAVSIGVASGPEEYMIGRLAGLMRMHDGTIVIADALAQDLRVFNDSGQFLRRVGRAGNGPGEFNWLTHIIRHAGDSIVVMDNEGSRANVLDPELGFVRRFRARLDATRAPVGLTSHRLIGFFSDGSLLVSDYLNVCGPLRMNGFCEDSVAFYRTDEEGNVEARFGRFVYSRQESKWGEVNVGFGEPHPQAMWVVRGDRFYYADAKRFEVRVFRSDGSLDRIIRVSADAPSYSRDELFPPRIREATSASDSRTQKAMELLDELRAQALVPDTLPWFSDMLVDETGHIWLREFVVPARLKDAPPRWFIFDAEGRLRYSFRSPSSLIRWTAPYLYLAPDISAEQVITWRRDADGVESVVVYRLRKRSAGM